MKTLFLLLQLFCLSTVLFAQPFKLETVIQKGHSASIKALSLSPDGKYLATGSRDKSIKLWDYTSGLEIRTLNGHEHTVNGVRFSPDGKLLLSSSADNTFKLWDRSSGKLLFSTEKERKYHTDVVFSPDGNYFLGGGHNDSVSLYDIVAKKKIISIAVNPDQGSGYGIQLAFSPDGKWFAIGEDDHTAKVFSAKDYSLVHTFKPSEGWCGGCGTFVTFSNDSKFLGKVSVNGVAEVYELATAKLVHSFGEPIKEPAAIGFSKDNKTLLLAGDKKIKLFDISKNTLQKEWEVAEYGELNDAIFSLDASRILAAFGSNVVLAFEIATGKIVQHFSGIINLQDKGGINYNPDNYYESYIAKYIRLKNNLILTKDTKSFITGKSGKNAVRWSMYTGKPDKVYPDHQKAVLCFDISNDGNYLITGDGSGEATLFELSSGKKISSYKGHREPIFDLKISPDGKSFFTTSWDAQLIQWDIASGEKTSVIDFKEYSGYTISYSPDGLYVVIGRLNKTLELREPDSKELVRTFIGHTDIVSSIQFGLEKNNMLTSSWDGTARLWDITTGMMLKKIKASSLPLHSAIFSPDGKKIITGGDDRKIRVYDESNSSLLYTLEGHQAEITSLTISKDGKTLISYSVDGVLKCWNLEKRAEFYEHMHLSEKDWMTRTSDGYFNATAGARSAIHFVKGMQVFYPDQFFEEYYRPELIPELYKNRGSLDSKPSIDEKLMASPPPTLKLAALLSEDGLSAEVHIKMIDNGGGVTDLKLMHNGKQLPFSKEEVFYPKGKSTQTTLVKEIPLVGGPNTFSVSAFSKGRIESGSVHSELFSDRAINTSVCHIISIGIDQYKNNALTLTYARDDAEAFAGFMNSKTKDLFARTEIHTFYDNQATRSAILDTLEALSLKISPHDVFVFFYAGHGSMVDEKFYFITNECTRLFDPTHLEKNAISGNELQQKFKNIKALKQLIIMDACQSGGSVELLATRGSQEEKAIAQLSRSAGIHVLASAGSEQNAKEITQLGHGLFTYVLLKALSGEADGSPNDGKITVYELKSYIDDQVPELNLKYSGKTQYPYTFSRGHDFPIVIK